MTNKPISRKANIVVQDLENEVLIYDLIAKSGMETKL